MERLNSEIIGVILDRIIDGREMGDFITSINEVLAPHADLLDVLITDITIRKLNLPKGQSYAVDPIFIIQFATIIGFALGYSYKEVIELEKLGA